MVKNIALFLIQIYQVFFSALLKQVFGVSRICRYTPSCSAYTARMIKKYGIISGGYLGVRRLLTCHPFHKNYDRTI